MIIMMLGRVAKSAESAEILGQILIIKVRAQMPRAMILCSKIQAHKRDDSTYKYYQHGP